MNKTIDRLKLVFLGLFAVGVVAIWAYQILWVWPAKRCDRQQAWWDPATRTCATPLYIPDLTGRPAGMTREEWSKKQAARKLREDAYGPGVTPPPIELPAADKSKPSAPAKATIGGAAEKK
ncbi:MAG: hypothetical protein KF842_09455 [Caulobacter sp.]|nr:hypothetical protein [Caulobacter sp.]